MASHAFITTWLMAPGGSGLPPIGVEWGAGFRGQQYDNVKKMSQVMSSVKFSYNGGNKVGISPAATGTTYSDPFGQMGDLAFCGYYWWNNAWFGGFIEWWPVIGGRTSRPLTNSDGQFEAAYKQGIRKFCFVITNRRDKRTNFGVLNIN